MAIFPFEVSLDRKVRINPENELKTNGVTRERLKAMVETACQLLTTGAPKVEEGQLHRLNKADTRNGIDSIKNLSRIGAPYAMLLYERFLGRPFAGHRDSVSELIGGRGFGVCREDMKKMILATRGKVFTVKTLNRLVECIRLKEFKAE